MDALMDTFHAKLAAAQRWEAAFTAWLIGQGYHVLPATDYSGRGDHAPRMAGNPPIIVPDLLVAKAGRAMWIEIKQKEHADWHYMSQRLVTGLPIRVWDHYQRVQAVTGLSVNVVFIHRAENVVVGGSLTQLEVHISHRYVGRGMDADGTLFFRFADLSHWCDTQCLMQYMAVQP